MEVALADGRTYLMGDRFNSADILLTTCLEWAIAYGVGICDNAHPYLERIVARPGYQRGTAANVPAGCRRAGAASGLKIHVPAYPATRTARSPTILSMAPSL